MAKLTPVQPSGMPVLGAAEDVCEEIGRNAQVFSSLPAANRHLPRVTCLLAQSARTFAEKDAIVTSATRLSYRDAFDRMLLLSERLSQLASPGSRTVIYMRNCIDAALLPLALRDAGIVSVPVNWRMSPLELANVVMASEAELILHDLYSADSVNQALDRLSQPGTRAVLIEQLDLESSVPFSIDVRPNANEGALASIHFTSGTLGAPKGVMQNHLNWEVVWRNMMSVRDFRKSDIVALTGPLSHAAGTYVVPLLLSGSTIMLPDDTSDDALAGEFDEHGITVPQCVPTLLTRLVASEAFCSAARQSLRLIVYGAESMPHATLRAAVETFGPIVAQNYGLTEAMMTCATLPPDEHALFSGGKLIELRHGIVGRPYPFVELVIRRADGSPVEGDEIGEITVRSPHVMLGYWRNPKATAEVLRNGWLWTGDLARWTADGYLSMAGRSKDMIICGGMNIYPAEVQGFLSQIPGVRQCAAFGVPSVTWGEELVAVVVIEDDSPEHREALRSRARFDLGIRTPKQWIFTEDLPRTSNGKTDFPALRALARQEAAE